MKRDYKNQVIWIIGASSGIGRALSIELSNRGATLLLSARRNDELTNLGSLLQNPSDIYPLDVSREESVMQTVDNIYKKYINVDRIIYLAAAYTPMKIDQLNPQTYKTIIDVNINGAFHLVHALIPFLKKHVHSGDKKNPKPQIALCGSVAGYIGLPAGQPYSATKAAIMNLAESMKAECKDYMDVRLISPGFVKTALTDKNQFKMPALLSAEDAAIAIADGLLKNSFEIHFPKRFTLFLKTLRILPYWIALALTEKIKT